MEASVFYQSPKGFKAEIIGKTGVAGELVFIVKNEEGERLFGGEAFRSVEEVTNIIKAGEGA